MQAAEETAPGRIPLTDPEGGTLSQTRYKIRREVAELPFAVITHHFGARRFLLRGLDQVRTEWRWLTMAFDLHKLMSLLRSRAGPAEALS